MEDIFDDADWDEITSGGEDEEECEMAYEDVMDTTASSTPVLITPARGDAEESMAEESNSEEFEDDIEEASAAAESARHATVARGWWKQWARSGAGAAGHGPAGRIRGVSVCARCVVASVCVLASFPTNLLGR